MILIPRAVFLSTLAALFATPALAQTGVVDQDNTANDNVAWNMGYFNDFQQEVVVGVAGQLEGFMIKMAAQNTANGLPVAIFLGGGPHPPGSTPAWSGTAYVPTSNLLQEVFIDASAALLYFRVNDVFTIRVGDAINMTPGMDLKGNAGWPSPYYNPSFYEAGARRNTDRLYFKTWVFGCASGSLGRYGSGCAGTGGFTPTLGWSGCPITGNPISVEITNGLGGSAALLLFGGGQGSIPLGGGCSLLVSPLVDPQVPVMLSGSAPGTGTATIPGTLPSGLRGQSFTMQALVLDPVSPVIVTATNGLLITVG